MRILAVHGEAASQLVVTFNAGEARVAIALADPNDQIDSSRNSLQNAR